MWLSTIYQIQNSATVRFVNLDFWCVVPNLVQLTSYNNSYSRRIIAKSRLGLQSIFMVRGYSGVSVVCQLGSSWKGKLADKAVLCYYLFLPIAFDVT